MIRRSHRITRAVLPLLVLVCLAIDPRAGSAQSLVRGSPDVQLDVSGSAIARGDVADDIEAAIPSLIDLGPLPDGAQVIAYSEGFNPGDALFVLGHTMTLPGPLTVRPRDVVQWDGVTYTILLPGGVNGIPDGAAIDAFALIPSTGHFWLSFDRVVDLGGLVVGDADVLNGATGTLIFDASAAGLANGIDVDAVSPGSAAGDVLLSFDVGGSIAGITFADEDVLLYNAGAGTPWTLWVDTAAVDPAWEPADLDAIAFVPEPVPALQYASSAALLAYLVRSRKRQVASAHRRRRDVRWRPGE